MSQLQIKGQTKLDGQFRPKLVKRADTEKAIAKKVRSWRRWNWLTVRWREVPTSLFLFVLPLIKFFVPSLCVLKSELRIKVSRANERTWPLIEERLNLRQLEDEYGPTQSGQARLLELDRLIFEKGDIEDYGVVGRHLVVTAGKNYVASAFDNTVEPENLKYHGYGIGTGAAAAGDTALGTELTTEYVVNSTRPTGSQAHSNATYTTVGTLSPDSGGTLAITEWGLFSATSSTTLFDRQVFSAVNLVASSDSLQTTYVLTLS